LTWLPGVPSWRVTSGRASPTLRERETVMSIGKDGNDVRNASPVALAFFPTIRIQ
jgi:hypothetical protein